MMRLLTEPYPHVDRNTHTEVPRRRLQEVPLVQLPRRESSILQKARATWHGEPPQDSALGTLRLAQLACELLLMLTRATGGALGGIYPAGGVLSPAAEHQLCRGART